MEANNNFFKRIIIDERTPRIYLHKSGKYMFNNKALDTYGLTEKGSIVITDYHRKRIYATISVKKSDSEMVDVTNMQASINDFPANVMKLDTSFFSYELMPYKFGQHKFTLKADELIILRTKRLTKEMQKPRETYLTQQKEKQLNNTMRICYLLDISQEKYNEMLFEAGYAYVSHKEFDTYFGNEIYHQSTFWQWWKNQYYIVDDALLMMMNFEQQNKGHLAELLDGKTLKEWYYHEHVYNVNIRVDDYVFGRNAIKPKTEAANEPRS